MLDASIPEKHQVRRSFARAAAHYDHFADMQRRVGHALLEQLPLTATQPQLLLDVGSGTGYFSQQLAQRYIAAQLISVDLAEEMLHIGRMRLSPSPCGESEARGAKPVGVRASSACKNQRCQFICGDAEALPLADACADLIYANLVLQWCAALARPLAEFARVLRPGGILAFSLFGRETLTELRQAWRAVDDYQRVNAFIDTGTLTAALLQAGFCHIQLQQQQETQQYVSVSALMHELKGLGAHNVSHGRSRHLTGKTALAQMESAYQALMQDGPIKATYSIIRLVAQRS